MREIRVPAKVLNRFVLSVFLKAGVRPDISALVAGALMETTLRGVDSHGVRLIPHYLAACKKGRINKNPRLKFKKTSPSTGILDADHTFGHAAGMIAAREAVELAKRAGTGHVAVANSTHFGAAACYSLEVARNDMIGLSFTHADSLIRSHGGTRAFLGTNPISFAAPCNGEAPFCLDMATSVITFNKVKQLREAHKPAPVGAGADKYGSETTDAERIAMLLPIGAHKGYGLSMMVEILCSLLTGMPYGPNISRMFAAPLNQKRYLGHFVSAMRIDCFQDKKVFKSRLTRMMRELRSEPSLNRKVPVRVAGDPEKLEAASRKKRGIPLKRSELEALKKLSVEYAVNFELIK